MDWGGEYCKDLRDHDESLSITERLLPQQSGFLGDEDPEPLMTMHKMTCEVSYLVGRHEEALPLLQEVFL
jgi:hypothetical protein